MRELQETLVHPATSGHDLCHSALITAGRRGAALGYESGNADTFGECDRAWAATARRVQVSSGSRQGWRHWPAHNPHPPVPKPERRGLLAGLRGR